MTLARGGLSWIMSFCTVTIFLFCLGLFIPGLYQSVFFFFFVVFLLISVLLVVFFRDPLRKPGQGIVAAADGVIREISQGNDTDMGDYMKISTFMNIHNVHVNRMPYDGEIQTITHCSGSHLPAFTKESERNERVVLMVKTTLGVMKIVLIAGTIARRIVPYIQQGDQVKKGGKIGLIRLGSRVDVYLPAKNIKQVTVSPKDKVKAGEDTIATVND